LKAFVDELQLELQRAEEIALQRKKRMEQSKQRMELENQELRRKAALGWMLGCLSGKQNLLLHDEAKPIVE